MKKFFQIWVVSLLFLIGSATLTLNKAQALPYTYYDYYDVGFYDDEVADDDWFYDYYEFGEWDPGVGYGYGFGLRQDYNWDTDVFSWEEEGLFAEGRNEL